MAKARTIRISRLSQDVTNEDLLQYFELTDPALADNSSLINTADGKKTATITFSDKASYKKAIQLHKQQGTLRSVRPDIDDEFSGFTALSEGTSFE
jgi:hypothetical protein